ncbi:MAG: hypothetical protein GWO08_10035 [Gammaproteobacteria bacterium]|nr:hypothetical protein [Gammaproteobacteria bacterium]NIQ10099.1 hypothetical protein [Gammaproteobacteria bacterium]NIQ18625.1 hypothetical protein [Gammaproteobacteria bacterium]NIQ74823.1 hypothetical protein [Gammaproteobacteria bacterium]NIR93990.1 hypothetical protein [Gammaproteobacteria bacterium]
MTRAKYLPASATKRRNYIAAITASVFLMVVIESIPAWVQVEATFKSPDQAPFINADAGRESIEPAISSRGMKLLQFEITGGVAVILWDEKGKGRNPPTGKHKVHNALYNGHKFLMNKFNAKKQIRINGTKWKQNA